jgi:hypothetical protein
MRALTWQENEHVEVIDVPDPAIQEPNDPTGGEMVMAEESRHEALEEMDFWPAVRSGRFEREEED